MRTIDRLMNSVRQDLPVRRVLVGAFWTAVVLDSHPVRCGLASTMHGGHHHHRSGPPMTHAGTLTDCSGRALAELLRSQSQLEASVGMAAFNALLDVDQAACVALNARDLIIERGADRRVAVVGHFPFVEQIRRAAARCWVLEITPRPGDIPAERADEVLPQADVVALTGTSLINHTFEDVMTHCRPDAFVLVLGASAPLTPLLFESGVDAVCGTYVVDPERVLPLVAQGATFRQIRRGGGVRLLTMMNEEMT